jgi:hypothetical protein
MSTRFQQVFISLFLFVPKLNSKLDILLVLDILSSDYCLTAH